MTGPLGPSVRERAYRALLAALQAALPMPVERGPDGPLPVEEPACRLFDRPAEKVDETLGVPIYCFEDPAVLELYLQDGWPEGRQAFIDEWVARVELALADRSLGGVTDWLEVGPPEIDPEDSLAADTLASATLNITLHYQSTRSSG